MLFYIMILIVLHSYYLDAWVVCSCGMCLGCLFLGNVPALYLECAWVVILRAPRM